MNIVRSFLVVGAISGAAVAAAPGYAEETLNPQTKKNLETAMHGEAFANLKYQAYAEHARKSGHPQIAKLFDDNANVEASEHFAREADALGLAKSDEANLSDGVTGEQYENSKMYAQFANEADAAGDKKVAALFRQIAADEGDHYAAYKKALETLQAGK
jgi:rubrerythrin